MLFAGLIAFGEVGRRLRGWSRKQAGDQETGRRGDELGKVAFHKMTMLKRSNGTVLCRMAAAAGKTRTADRGLIVCPQPGKGSEQAVMTRIYFDRSPAVFTVMTR